MTSQDNAGDLEITDDFSIVNIVGTGDLGDDDFELSLEALQEELPYETYQNPSDNPGLTMEFNDEGALTKFYESGKFIILVPHGSEELLFEKYEEVKETLIELGLVSTTGKENPNALLNEDEIDFEVSNIVCLENLDTQINLPALSIALGLAEVEYEPEEFPALVFRTDEYPCTFMVFANGKVIVAGATSYEEAKENFKQFLTEVNKWLGDDF